MDTLAINNAIEKFVNERKNMPKEKAVNRFIVRVCLEYGKKDIHNFLLNTIYLTRWYIILSTFFKKYSWTGRIPHFLSAVFIAIGGSLYLYLCNYPELSICLTIGAIITIKQLFKNAVNTWCEESVNIAIYIELIEASESTILTITQIT